MRTYRWIRPALLGAGIFATLPAAADPSVSVHVEAAAAHEVGDDTSARRFGWGGAGVIAPELAFGEVFGLELALGAIALSGAESPPDEPGIAPTDAGVAGFSTVGPRVRPLATLAKHAGPFDTDGLWLAGGFGAGLTGDAVRPTIRAALGFDAESHAFSGGPFVGYFQMVEPDDGSLRPEDAKVAIFGLHGALFPASRKVIEPTDSDGDGLFDDVDKCPQKPEDKDRFEDQDGCPDPDNDKDGIPDKSDACPSFAEDKDGFEDQDGCPEADNDHDGLEDRGDACPNEAEDKDGFLDDDGCPDLDNDHDGVPDATDACPAEPETPNGILDEDGCPDTEDLHVTKDHIVLDDRVQFATNSAEINKASWDFLSRVAEFIKAHPEYARIHVSGHADDTGPDAFNDRLSAARAAAVRLMLIRFGVEEARLEISAYGEHQPLAQGTTAEARAKNRRVEFEILERKSALAQPAQAAPAGAEVPRSAP